MIKNYLNYAVAAAFFMGSGTGLVLAAEAEKEDNDSFSKSQRLVIDSSRRIEVNGAIGNLTTATPPVSDVDFYSFFGKKGDTITVDIDAGMKSAGAVRSLDSVIAVFAPDGTVLRQANDTLPIDTGSISRFDPRLENVFLPVSGMYTVGVASDATYPDRTKRVFSTNGAITPFVGGSVSNGSYLLILEGVSPSAIQIAIDIKPGLDRITRINPKAKGTIPVALLTSDDFDATKADESSIRFGPNGTEASGHCNRQDANHDRRADLLCHFDLGAAGFDESATEGMVTGTIDGMPFEGRAWLKVIPVSKD
jgi:hypothetical protein